MEAMRLDFGFPTPSPSPSPDHFSYPMPIWEQILIPDFVTIAAAMVIMFAIILVQDARRGRKIRCICGHPEKDHTYSVANYAVTACGLCRCLRFIEDWRTT